MPIEVLSSQNISNVISPNSVIGCASVGGIDPAVLFKMSNFCQNRVDFLKLKSESTVFV